MQQKGGAQRHAFCRVERVALPGGCSALFHGLHGRQHGLPCRHVSHRRVDVSVMPTELCQAQVCAAFLSVLMSAFVPRGVPKEYLCLYTKLTAGADEVHMLKAGDACW